MRSFNRSSGIAFAVYFGTAVLLTMSWWRGVYPFPFLSGDGGNIAGFAAGWGDPEGFRNDPFLGRTEYYRFYATIHIPWLIVVGRLVGDIGSAFLLLQVPTLLLQAIGYRRLGLEITGNHRAALLLGMMSFGTVSMNIDFYGSYADALPRSLFQAAFPFILAALVRYRDRPSAWPAIFAACGLTTYLHPVSSPSVALATWLTLAVCADAPARRRFRSLMLSGVLFLLVSAPFAVIYLGGHEHGRTDASPEEVLLLLYALYGKEFLDALEYFSKVASKWQAGVLLPVAAAIGSVAVWRWRRSGRPILVLLGVWMVALLISSVGVTLVEQELLRRFNILPVEIDTVRNVRYLVPVLTMLGMWGVAAAASRLAERPGTALLAAAALAWLAVNRPALVPFRDTAACLAAGRLLCPPADWMDQIAVLEHLRTTVPRGTVVLPGVDRYTRTELGQAVRYRAGLPLAFSYKDGGVMGYSNTSRVRAWQRLEKRMQLARHYADLGATLDLAEETGAALVLVDFPVELGQRPDWRLRYAAGPFSVIERSPR